MDFYPNKGVQTSMTGTNVNWSTSSELPKLEDAMYIMVKDGVYSVVGATTNIPNGCDVIALKVVRLKKAKTVLE